MVYKKNETDKELIFKGKKEEMNKFINEFIKFGIMTKRIILCIIGLFVLAGVSHAQDLTIQEKLGYPKDTKLLIIHADDLGLSHSENMASIYAMENGTVNSGSIMVPCPWFAEMAAYARSHPDADLGLHLTLTSEWELYKWGPLLPSDEVPSLINEQGFLYDNIGNFFQNAKEQDIEKELRAQINRAIKFGIKPTHLDCHMASLCIKPEFLKIYLKLGREYRLPILLNKEMAENNFHIDLKPYITDDDILVNYIFMAMPENYYYGLDKTYTETLNSLQYGLNVILVHAAYDNMEMQGITENKPDWGSSWRNEDFVFFTSNKCKDIIEREHIRLITWKEIKNKLIDQ